MANYQQSAGKVFRSMLGLLKADRKDISAIYFYAILAGLVQLSLPLGIQSIINFVLAGTVSTSIVVLIVLVVGGTILGGLLQVRQLQLIEKLKQKIFVRYSLEFADRIPRLNVEKLDKYHLPELINRFFEVPSFQKGIEKILLDLPTALIQMALGLLLLSFYHPVFIAFGALLILAIVLILKDKNTFIGSGWVYFGKKNWKITEINKTISLQNYYLLYDFNIVNKYRNVGYYSDFLRLIKNYFSRNNLCIYTTLNNYYSLKGIKSSGFSLHKIISKFFVLKL